MYESIKDKPTIIVNGLSNKQLLEVMKKVKEIEGLPEIVFASVTPTSCQWTVTDLINELNAEHEEMKKVNKNLKEGVYKNQKEKDKK
ncbi:DUF3783 domain-containing protein [Geotoga petraea]|jgi:hypothetical protein|uniref:DUF3783 domain-containing protein n=1 Tax=Geotoga petraea TaxID=28234 RepID=A0A1G6HT45_9BACT|nr:DUF3783 domain-containing protein [Geotoga petraea]MDK2946507.1 hypothetical protein [Geotoga sp.]TGG88961.1 DUF3783 domain-containing protein [Geotoga petraea]SDB97459.1 protein of unknown function [Geotoga petraea]